MVAARPLVRQFVEGSLRTFIAEPSIAEPVAGESASRIANPLRALTVPLGVLIAVLVGAGWYATWASSTAVMNFLGAATTLAGVPRIFLAFLLLVVMMVAMMLPSALPMVLAFRGISRLEAGRPVRPPDNVGTALFASSYFVVWGGFALIALLGLFALGLMNPLMMPTMAGPLLFAPAGVVLVAGGYQMTRLKDACLRGCQSPMQFVLTRWRTGRGGAVRMGLVHSLYCIGCCWLFMIVLFVAGAMSLLWMGLISIVIFAEKVGPRATWPARLIGVLFLVFGAILAAQAVLSL
jgi:predicted metal-binding membrane protein